MLSMESDTRMAIIVIFLISAYKLTKLEYYDGVWLPSEERNVQRHNGYWIIE